MVEQGLALEISNRFCVDDHGAGARRGTTEEFCVGRASIELRRAV